jgi:hypothetical protein
MAYYDGLAPKGDHPCAASVRLELAGVLARSAASKAEAIDIATAAVHQRERLFGETGPLTQSARQVLAKLAAHS